MTWEQTIEKIRREHAFRELIEKAYFEEDLALNVERFKESEEYDETLRIIREYAPNSKNILDVGSGNGISAISFALDGYHVVVSEPDPSETVGAGAVRKLTDHYKLSNVEVYEQFAEEINLPDFLFDIVYVRQAMHHAYDLGKFIANISAQLKPGGLLLTVRDHVVYDESDKEWFLNNHPLHKFYGGENAFTLAQYTNAFKTAGLKVQRVLKHFDSVINYFPMSKAVYDKTISDHSRQGLQKLRAKVGPLSRLKMLQKLYVWLDNEGPFDESKIPGRMYSFIAIKN